jgi:hypothetical protein
MISEGLFLCLTILSGLLFVSLAFWGPGGRPRARSGLNRTVEPQAAKERRWRIAMAAVRKRRFRPGLAVACACARRFETRRAEFEAGYASAARSHRTPRARGAAGNLRIMVNGN